MTTAAEVTLPGHRRTDPPRRRAAEWVRRRSAGAAIFAAAGTILFFAYLAQDRTVPANSDGAGQALQAWDLLHGNVLLHGWVLGDVSYYTTEIPEYALVELFRGLSAETVHVAAALTYTLMVLLAAALARGRATGRSGLARMLIAGGIMLAPSLGPSTQWLMSSPDHTGTSVPLLAIWLVLDRAPRRWWVPVIIMAALAWAQLGDPILLLEAVLPLVAVCAISVVRRDGELAAKWFELTLAAGALASAAIATETLQLIRQAGGFMISAPYMRFARVGELSSAIWIKLAHLLDVFGADFFGLHPLYAFAQLLHLVGLSLVVWAVVHATRRLFAEDDLVVQVLAVGFLMLLAAFTFGIMSGAWEVAGLLPMGAVLAGRLLADKLIGARLAAPLAVVLACYGLLLLHNAIRPAAVGPYQRLATFLEDHHLSYGLSGYWNASVVTLDSGNRVQVRPGFMRGDTFVSGGWEADSSWYDPRLHDASFLVFDCHGCRGGSFGGVRNIDAAFGKPAMTYRTGSYLVLVWNTNLLDGPIVSQRPTPGQILAFACAYPYQRHSAARCNLPRIDRVRRI